MNDIRCIYVCDISVFLYFFFFSSRRRHTRWPRDWSSDVCSSDLDRRPDQADDLALLDPERKIVHGPEAAEVLRQAFGLEERHPPGPPRAPAYFTVICFTCSKPAPFTR